jgi:outer membrane protein
MNLALPMASREESSDDSRTIFTINRRLFRAGDCVARLLRESLLVFIHWLCCAQLNSIRFYKLVSDDELPSFVGSKEQRRAGFKKPGSVTDMRTHRWVKKVVVVTLGVALVKLGIPGSVWSQSHVTPPAPMPTIETRSAERLTLTEAVEIALDKNPLTRATAARRELADAQVAAARATRLPVVQASESVTTSNNPVFVFGSLLEQGRFGPQNFLINSLNNPDALTNIRTGLSVRMPLFDQRQSKARIDVARLGQQQADQETELVAQQIRFRVLKSFYGLLLAQSRVVIADEAIQIGVSDLKSIKDKFETGFVVRSDLLAAEVQLAEFRQQKIQALGEVATAQAALNTAIGLPVDSALAIDDELSARVFEVEGLDELKHQALLNRPEYARAMLAVRSNAREVLAARDEVLPRVDAFSSIGLSGRSPVTGSSDYTVGASLTVTLFDAGRKARINEARAAEAIAKAEQEHTANQISFEVVNAYQQFVSARERLLIVAQTTTQAQEVLRMVRDRYLEGLTTITEVLRAELALVRARTDAQLARHDHYLAYATVLLATGRLKDVRPFVV